MRITIDLDNKKRYHLITSRLLEVFGIIDEIWVSASKKGYHFIILDTPFTVEENILLRSLLGDDKVRIWMDKRMLHYKPFQVLWTQKGNKKAKLIANKVLK